MNDKGYTLIEVIGVVIILSFIILMIVPNVSDSLKNSRNKAYEVQISEIESATKSWSIYNSNNLPATDQDEITIDLLQLKLAGFISYDFVNPKTGEPFPDNMQIKIKKKGLNYVYTVLTDTGDTSTTINPSAPSIIVNGSTYLYLEVNEHSLLDIPNAVCKDSNIEVQVKYEKEENGEYVETSEILFDTLGKYRITYSASNAGGTNTINRYVEIVDTTPPQISIPGYENDVCLDLEMSGDFNLPSATVTDNYTNSLNIELKKIGNISNVPGIKKVTYQATDSSNNVGKFVLCVNMMDTHVPEITSIHAEYSATLKADIITVTATDTGVGLHDNAYSFDGGKNWQKNNYFKVASNIDKSTIGIVVRDKIGLQTEKYRLYKEEILSGNDPVLDKGMTPIYYENDIAKVADITEEWYNYGNKIWANAVILKENPSKDYSKKDTVVDESDVLAYFVWIPRYEYTIKGSYGVNGTSSNEPGYIDIKFSKLSEKKAGTATYTGNTPSNYLTHPAFTFGDKELRGIWVGKFETTGTGSNPTIKPSISSLRSQDVSTQFETALKFKNYGLENESRMMKNDEWGAVAYLSQSLYGRCPSTGTCPEIRRNNNNSYLTGYGEVNRATTGWSETSVDTNQYGTDEAITKSYDTEIGKEASTTMNITGIYDMNGGAEEFVMGVLTDSNGKPYSGRNNDLHSGYNGPFGNPSSGDSSILELTTGKNWPESKYYNLYTSSDQNTACSGKKCLGHANGETAGWYGDATVMPNARNSWVTRGRSFHGGSTTGLFGFDAYAGSAYGRSSFRVVAPM